MAFSRPSMFFTNGDPSTHKMDITSLEIRHGSSCFDSYLNKFKQRLEEQQAMDFGFKKKPGSGSRFTKKTGSGFNESGSETLVPTAPS